MAERKLKRYEETEAYVVQQQESELRERSNQAAHYYEMAERRARELSNEMGVAGLRAVELERV